MSTRTGIILLLLIALLAGYYLYVPVSFSDILSPAMEKQTVESRRVALETSVLQRLQPEFNALGLTRFPDAIRLLALKEERQLQVFAQTQTGWKLLKVYPFTAYSGTLGPKLREGDGQIPEGIYAIEYLNPNSAFYLSMKVNYPNAFDREKAREDNRSTLGGDIFIHGKAQTIGCIPIGDDAIEELFLLADHALSPGIEVIISPWDFRKKAAFPALTGIGWAQELYTSIAKEINTLPQ